jgi:hypothetical protein
MLPVEVEMSEYVRILAMVSRMPMGGESIQDVKQRAEGEFLRELVALSQPMLRESMGSHRILLATDAHGVVALKADGIFVHVDRADQEDAIDAAQVLDAEPNLLTILDRLEAELDAVGDLGATSAADIVRLARYSVKAARQGNCGAPASRNENPDSRNATNFSSAW